MLVMIFASTSLSLRGGGTTSNAPRDRSDARAALDRVERLGDARAGDALLRVPLVDPHGALDLDQLAARPRCLIGR